MHLRYLAFLEARWSCQIKAVHIPGTDNEVADALRNRADVACALMQGADNEPVAVPEEVLRAVARVQRTMEYGTCCGQTRVSGGGRIHYEVIPSRYWSWAGDKKDLLPVSEESLCMFVASLEQEGLSSSTVNGIWQQ